MERCPTCKAPYKGKQYCHRCGTDLGRLLEIRDQAGRHHEHALAAFSNGDFQQMHYHARRACGLYRTPASEKLLACAAILSGKPEAALAAWRSVTEKAHVF